MVDLTKLTKAKLIEYIESLEDTRFENFKLQLGMPYDDEGAWIDYIKKIQDLNAERLNDCKELTELLEKQNLQIKVMVGCSNYSHR
jgi:hypothetical protein